ncbi:odorant receptor 10-like [Megachile rotundata]|uniref:odorant receptor 10-like n=1 Tax=Megachile rotundata TaxID=143995 RepID=UPI000258DD0A|nr:PREDICTED: odorant receptor 4-like [Megachile rotundata]
MRDRSFDNVVLKNSYYSADIQYSLQMCQWTLKPIGIWPLIYHRVTRREKLISVVLLILGFSLLFFILIPSCRFIFFEGHISTKVRLLGPVGYRMSTTVKYIYLALRGSIFGRCIEHVERDWRTVQDQRHRSIMLECAGLSRKLITMCAAFLYTGGLSHHTVHAFFSKDRRHSNVTIRPLIYPGYDAFFDTQASPTYEIIYCMQLLSSLIVYTIGTATYSLLVIFVMHICGQIQIQMARLENLKNARLENLKNAGLEKGQRNPLSKIVYNHVEILKFSEKVQKALEEICFTAVVECTINMCLLQYYCLKSWKASDTVQIVTYITLLMSFTYNIFVFCYIGEVLTEQCSQIGVASYDIDWYNLPAKNAHDLVLLNIVSQNPPKLLAGRIIELSLNTFTAVVKTSVAYMNLLRTVTD